MHPLVRVQRYAAAILLLAGSGVATAQSGSSGPIRWLLTTPPGGTYDIASRAVAPVMAAALGQPIVIENRPGANGAIAAEALLKSKPDGRTVILASNTMLALGEHLYRKLPYSPGDFAVIGLFSKFPYALFVHESVPASTLKDLIAYARAQPDRLNYGTIGNGSTSHLAGEAFAQATGTKLVNVPYKGAAEIVQDLNAGRIQIYFAPPAAGLVSQVAAGRLRALGVASSARMRELPGVPTLTELGVLPDMELGGWNALAAPAGTPREVVTRLNAELVRALGAPQVRDAFEKIAAIPQPGTPEEGLKFAERERAAWGPIIAKMGVKLD